MTASTLRRPGGPSGASSGRPSGVSSAQPSGTSSGTSSGVSSEPESVLEALVRVRLVGETEHEAFEKRLRDIPAVVDAWRLAGDCDYEVRLRCPTLSGLDDAVNELRDAGGHTSTTLVLHRVTLEKP